MRPRLLIAVVLCAVATTALAQEKTRTAAEARQHIGAVTTVCGKVISPRYASSSRGKPTFLNLDKAFPHQEFRVVIWGSVRPKFGKPEVTYRDKNICVTGQVQSYKGAAEIIATDPQQIRVQETVR